MFKIKTNCSFRESTCLGLLVLIGFSSRSVIGMQIELFPEQRNSPEEVSILVDELPPILKTTDTETTDTETDTEVPSDPSNELHTAPASELQGSTNTSEFHELQGIQNSDFGDELLRGPVHEAFAEAYLPEPDTSIVVDRAPPPPIPEIPPEVRPTGDNVEWIPGYWFWDEERNDYLWISGVWRQIPPGTRWLPGYWAQLEGQHQWVSGTWIPASNNQAEYLSQSPPESLDLGPVGEPPSVSHFWVPGCWIWRDVHYAWRPGYWSVGYNDWVWIPNRYVWSPRGYLFCPGYWDYPLVNRGTLFAPVYFRQAAFLNPGFFYRPRLVLPYHGVLAHLWVGPRLRHYYFGDYYANRYRQSGLYPWHMFHQNSAVRFGNRATFGYDPLFAHSSRIYSAQGINLSQQLTHQFNTYMHQPNLRPPRTYIEQRSRGLTTVDSTDRTTRSLGEFWRTGSAIGEPLSESAQRAPDRFTRDLSRDFTRNPTQDPTRQSSLRANSTSNSTLGRHAELSSLRREFESVLQPSSSRVDNASGGGRNDSARANRSSQSLDLRSIYGDSNRRNSLPQTQTPAVSRLGTGEGRSSFRPSLGEGFDISSNPNSESRNFGRPEAGQPRQRGSTTPNNRSFLNRDSIAQPEQNRNRGTIPSASPWQSRSDILPRSATVVPRPSVSSPGTRSISPSPDVLSPSYNRLPNRNLSTDRSPLTPGNSSMFRGNTVSPGNTAFPGRPNMMPGGPSVSPGRSVGPSSPGSRMPAYSPSMRPSTPLSGPSGLGGRGFGGLSGGGSGTGIGPASSGIGGGGRATGGIGGGGGGGGSRSRGGK